MNVQDQELQTLRLLWHSIDEQQRRLDTENLYKMYTQDWKEQLRQRIFSLFSPQTAELLHIKANTSLNILKWVSDELSQIYAEAPIRRFVPKPEDTTPPSQESLDAALKWYEGGGKLNLALDRAAKLNFALREVVIRPHVSEKRLSLEVLTPDKVMALPNAHDYTRLQSILVRLDEYRFGLWTKDSFRELDTGLAVVTEDSNRYRRIPYLVCHASFPVEHFWHHFESNALREATLAAGVGMTDHSHIRHLQSFKQVWVSTDKLEDAARTMLLDPAGIVELRGNSSIGVLDIQADLEKHLNSVLQQAGSVLALYGIRPEQLKGTLDASSGFALSIKLLGTIRAWKTQRRVWEVWERELWDLTREVALHNGVELPPCDLEIEWQSPLQESFDESSVTEAEAVQDDTAE